MLMQAFFIKLHERNKLLFWFGFYSFFLSLVCFVLALFDSEVILGAGRYIKPLKYYLAIVITSWTMAIILHYLNSKPLRTIVSIIIALTLFGESSIILLQSIRVVASHYNTSTPFNKFMYDLMISCMVIFTVTIFVLTILFYNQKKMACSQHFATGIRMGLLLYSVFSIIGFIMIRNMSHTIGGQDGGEGLLFFNWSIKYGDLRISHMMGVHVLQIIPLLSYYVFKKKNKVLFFSFCYFLLVLAITIISCMKMPLISY